MTTRTKIAPTLRQVCVRLREEADAKITEARRIHEAPSMFLDRDSRCRTLIGEAEGMKRAAFVMLEEIARLSSPGPRSKRRRTP